MAFKYVLLSLCAVLSLANGGLLAPAATYVASPVVAKLAQPHYDAVGTTQQNVVRSFGGTVSTYSKNVVTPYSSVSKVDSRTTNNVYTPAIAKTVYSAPVAVTKSVYAAAAPAVTYAAPAPVVAKTVSYAAPAVTYAAPAPVLAKTVYSAPVAAPVIAKTYAAAPAVAYSAPVAAPAAYVKYSPAIGVSHVTFDGFGTHWGF